MGTRTLNLTEEFNRASLPPAGWSGSLHFTNDAGERIRYAHAPATGPSQGTVVLTHGYGGSIDQFYETMKIYQEQGYDVWAMDWANMGKSEREDSDNPARPSTKGLQRHVDDLDKFVKEIVRNDPEKPLIMSTHSMGGHVGLLYLQQHQDVFDGAIMGAPMFGVYRFGLPHSFRPVAKFAFNAASTLGFKNVSLPDPTSILNVFRKAASVVSKVVPLPSFLSNNIEGPSNRSRWANEIDRKDPQTDLNDPTFGWVAASFRTSDKMLSEEAIKSIRTPILIGSAGEESIVSNNEQERVARLLGDNATFVKVSGSGHAIWHESQENHELWWGNIASFLQERESRFVEERATRDTPQQVVADIDRDYAYPIPWPGPQPAFG